MITNEVLSKAAELFTLLTHFYLQYTNSIFLLKLVVFTVCVPMDQIYCNFLESMGGIFDLLSQVLDSADDVSNSVGDVSGSKGDASNSGDRSGLSEVIHLIQRVLYPHSSSDLSDVPSDIWNSASNIFHSVCV